MSPAAFREWRKRLGLSQAEAAAVLGLGKRGRIIGYYESGEKEIPRYIALACAAVALGIRDYPG